MFKRILLLLVSFILFENYTAQITIIAHAEMNTYPITGISVLVKENDKTIQTLNSGKKATFNINLAFDKKYKIYVQHTECPVMYFELDATKIPAEKQSIKMFHELDIPFYLKQDEDIDTSVFSQPCQKIYFDGVSKMVSDTAYITRFYRSVIKSQKNEQPVLNESSNINMPSTLAAQVLLRNDPRLSVKNQTITIFGTDGKILKTTLIDRFGNFVVTNINAASISKIQLSTTNELIPPGQEIYLNNSAQKHTIKSISQTNKTEWVLSNADKAKLINNGYTSNIGGKLIHVTKGKKTFLANRTVYLSNKRNTIIKKTKTNDLGAYAFDEIKPDQVYFVGIDAKEISKGEKVDMLNKDDQFASSLDTTAAGRISTKIISSNNQKFNALNISESEMRMNVNAKLYGDNVSNPLSKIKILLLNDAYEVIDSTVTNDLGFFKFKYLPYLKRFYLSAENDHNQLDVFNNILMYSSDDNLVKVLTHVKGSKFIYKPINSEINKIREIDMEDPWLDLSFGKKDAALLNNQIIIEPILFETNKAELLPAAIETLDKIVTVLKNNTTVKIEITAHTDSKGSDQDNLKLSEARAKAVQDHLIKNGIQSNRLRAIGLGETKILNRCKNGIECSDIEHAINRRVEFKILSK